MASCPSSPLARVNEVKESTDVVVEYKDLFEREALYALDWMNSTVDVFVGAGGTGDDLDMTEEGGQGGEG